VLLCSNAAVLTSEGLEKLGEGDWWYHFAAIVLWFLIALWILMLVVSRKAHQKHQREFGWSDENFFTEDEVYKKKGGSLLDLKNVKQNILETVSVYATPEGIVETTIENVIASRKGVDVHMVDRMMDHNEHCMERGSSTALDKNKEYDEEKAKEAAIQSTPKSEGATPKATPKSVGDSKAGGSPGGLLTSAPKRAKTLMNNLVGGLEDPLQRLMDMSGMTSSANVIEDFFSAGFSKRVLILFIALHPVLMLWRFHAEVPATVKFLLLGARFLGALMLSCLFFQADGSATKVDADVDCSTTGLGAQILKSVIIGLLSTLTSLIVLLILGLMQNRTFIYREKWTEAAKQTKLRTWMLLDGLLWFFGLGYSGFCILFIMAFLANVNSEARTSWAFSTFTAIFNTFFITPLATGVVFAGLATLAVRRKPEVLDKVRGKLGVEGKKAPSSPMDKIKGAANMALNALGISTKMAWEEAKIHQPTPVEIIREVYGMNSPVGEHFPVQDMDLLTLEEELKQTLAMNRKVHLRQEELLRQVAMLVQAVPPALEDLSEVPPSPPNVPLHPPWHPDPPLPDLELQPVADSQQSPSSRGANSQQSPSSPAKPIPMGVS
jgi:hypothetical protein